MRWLTLWLFFAPYITFSQPGFNFIYDLSYPSGGIANGLYSQGLLYLYVGVSNIALNRYEVAIQKADTNGIAQEIFPIADPNGKSILTGNNYRILELSDGNLALIGGYEGEWAYFFAILNREGEVLLFKKNPNANGYPYLHEIIEVSDGYLFGGPFAPLVDGVLRNFVTKVDKQGNVLWRKEYWDKPDWTYLMQSMTKIDDNEIVIGSVQGYTGFGQGHVFAIDSLANKKWEKIAPAYKENPVINVQKCPTATGCIWRMNKKRRM